MLFTTFPAGLSSVFQDDYEEPESPFLPGSVGLDTLKAAVNALPLWTEGAQGGIVAPSPHGKRPQTALQLLWPSLSWLRGSTFRGFILVPPRYGDSQSGNLNQSNKCLLIAYHVQPESRD